MCLFNDRISFLHLMKQIKVFRQRINNKGFMINVFSVKYHKVLDLYISPKVSPFYCFVHTKCHKPVWGGDPRQPSRQNIPCNWIQLENAICVNTLHSAHSLRARHTSTSLVTRSGRIARNDGFHDHQQDDRRDIDDTHNE